MIVEFSVQNFRSIKDLQTLSFIATNLESPEDLNYVDANNIVSMGDLKLLKTLGIYGCNSSGKSNIIRALDYFIRAIRNEASTESRLGVLCDPFLYQEAPYKQESFFQIVAVIEDKKYRYGFTVRRNDQSTAQHGSTTNREIIVDEWLFGQKEKNMVELFTRHNGVVNKDKLGNKEPIPEMSSQHNLFLTYASSFDKEGVCARVRRYFTIDSYGTQNILGPVGVVFPAFTMPVTGLILIDNHLHGSLLLKIVNLLNNPEVNKDRTQLVFTSRDTNMLSPTIMRRDQFYFTEKGSNESSRLYSLADLKGIPNDADFAKQYLAGYYGGVAI
ncbi:AAA family ATPase [Parachryseolinea silvisoli]|uniref:AAA family ATPase n=1 Tax=Parachryseolinea silvisoli TaxID=2873601 RepID=UPI0022657FB8|nr:ATP-binding protein [Parachryseolinea silvisoli]MCD9017504.1 ATP-binding protein [Parachryseolinea silvisoli]